MKSRNHMRTLHSRDHLEGDILEMLMLMRAGKEHGNILLCSAN
jgi:hypothetical protein